MAIWTTAITSPASAPNMVNPRMSSRCAPTSAFMKPRVSPVVRVRRISRAGSVAMRAATPRRRASTSFKPTRATCANSRPTYPPPRTTSRSGRRSSSSSSMLVSAAAASPGTGGTNGRVPRLRKTLAQ